MNYQASRAEAVNTFDDFSSRVSVSCDEKSDDTAVGPASFAGLSEHSTHVQLGGIVRVIAALDMTSVVDD